MLVRVLEGIRGMSSLWLSAISLGFSRRILGNIWLKVHAADFLGIILQDVTEKGLDEYTIFISYRVKTDSAIAQILFDELNNKTTAQGKLVTCYLDKVRLKDGEDWQKGFISGLRNSAIYIPIVSYGFTAPYHSLSTKFGQDGDELDKTPAGKKRLAPFRIKGFNLPSWVAMIFNDLFKGWFHDAEDNCLIELMYAMKLKDSAEKEKTVQHKLRSIFPLFVGRQKEDGAMMRFFDDMSDGGGGYANKGVSIKCKKKVSASKRANFFWLGEPLILWALLRAFRFDRLVPRRVCVFEL
jgi:hypothetical protein